MVIFNNVYSYKKDLQIIRNNAENVKFTPDNF